MPTRKLTSGDEETLIAAYEGWDPTVDTRSAEDIAKGFDVTRQTMYRVLRKHNVPLKAAASSGYEDRPLVTMGAELDRQRDEMRMLRQDVMGIREEVRSMRDQLIRTLDRHSDKQADMQGQVDQLAHMIEKMGAAGQRSGAHLMEQIDRLADAAGVEVDGPESYLGE